MLKCNVTMSLGLHLEFAKYPDTMQCFANNQQPEFYMMDQYK